VALSPSEPRTLRQAVHTLPGRLVLLSGGLLALLFLARLFVDLPDVVVLFRRVVAIAFAAGLGWLAFPELVRRRRWLLWRVRVKLILSYVFLGLVPVVLVVTFALAGGVVLYNNVAAYLFHEGMTSVLEDVEQAADLVAGDLVREPESPAAVLQRTYESLRERYPALSLAVVPAPRAPGQVDGAAPARLGGTVATAGPWRHAPAPATVPSWSLERPFTGLLALVAAGPGGDEDVLLVRVVRTAAAGRLAVVSDLPVNTALIATLDDQTGTRIRAVGGSCLRASDGSPGAEDVPLLPGAIEDRGDEPGAWLLFNRTVVFMDCTLDWRTGEVGRLPISLTAPVGRLYDRLVSVQPSDLTELFGSGDVFLAVLAVLGALFLVVQGAALVMGAMLARSITYAIHELFVGTERIQRGDFAHRIRIESKDQLGDLAGSFNKMSASIEHLLHVQREKQRLDEELRIAREIQKSLLPDEPPRLDGLAIADLCEPAREVGGDYYDFFVLGPRRLGVMIADVSGKGTSAALYMAELKGLMLALSHDEPSPRQLLIEVNQRLAGQLDSRSFITMTYAVLDLDAGVMTHARAGHTPLIVVSDGRSEIIQPEGMILGLCLPEGSVRFADMLVEHTCRIGPGDVIVLYTDGVTEAMDREGELFGDASLASVVTSHHGLDPAGIRERVVREVKAFVRDAEPHDDMTMIVLKVGAPSGAAGPA
jgi:sigma-B regulation protein RsbU (phosphoserine phosphatase)